MRAGQISDSYSYDPFGEITAVTHDGTAKTPLEAKNDNGLSDNDVLWGYNGEEYIEEVGLQYLRQRHYSPETGTFTSQDTNEGDLTNPLSQNRYIYAENDPVNGNDPGGDKKKAKKTSTKKTNKKTTKSSSKSSKKTTAKKNTKKTTKKSSNKKKSSSKKSSSKKSGSLWNKLKTKATSKVNKAKKAIKKKISSVKDKAKALKNSVKCGSAKVMRKITGIDRKISKALTPKKKDSVVKKYLKGAGSNLYGQYKDLARSFISGNGDLTLGILKETSKSLGSSLLHPKSSVKGMLNYYPDMVKKNGLAYTAGNISVDIAEIAIAKKVSTGAVKNGTKITVVPSNAKTLAKQIKDNNGSPLPGYKGGRTYKNIPVNPGDQKLPEGVKYREYDVNKYVKGQNRGKERLVIGDDGSVWYTNDHYHTFVRVQ